MLVMATFVASCSTGRDALELMPPENIPESVQVLQKYKIGVDDELQVSVWRHPDLSIGVVVRPDGKISLPLIGDLAAAGVTTEELTETVQQSLRNYIRSPQATVIVTRATSAQFLRRISVTGAVNRPQSVVHQQGITVFDAILQAGGLNPFARGNDAKLYRRNKEGKMKVYSIRLNDILEDGRLDTNYRLIPSDIISVPERAF